MERDDFREALLAIMERKVHWAWSAFASGKVAKPRLHVHFEQEYATYVRDFPVLVGRAYVQCPVAEVRPTSPRTCTRRRPAASSPADPTPSCSSSTRAASAWTSRGSSTSSCCRARVPRRARRRHRAPRLGGRVAVTTIFLEGTDHERGELDDSAPRRPAPPLERHPLVVHYGLPLDALALTKAHRRVEGSHRAAAWRCLLDHVVVGDRAAVVTAMQSTLDAWLAYRDDVAAACGVTR